jgi:hypothetical protein
MTSGQWVVRTQINGSRHAALVNTAHFITVCSDGLHIVKILKIVYGTSWKSRKMSWKKKGQEVGLYMSKINDGSIYRTIPAKSATT